MKYLIPPVGLSPLDLEFKRKMLLINSCILCFRRGYWLLILSWIIFSCSQTAIKGVTLLDPVQFEGKIQEINVQLVDVRTPNEWKSGVIANPLKIDFLESNFKEKIEKLNKSKPIAIYCKSGGRSGQAAKLLSENGFKEIYDLKGGILNWNKK